VKALLEKAWDDAAGSTVAALSLSNAEITAPVTVSAASAPPGRRRLQVRGGAAVVREGTPAMPTV